MFHVERCPQKTLCKRIPTVPQSRPVDIVQTGRLADAALAAYLKASGASTPAHLALAIERMQVSCATALMLLQVRRALQPRAVVH